MEKLTRYREIIRQVAAEYAAWKPRGEEVVSEIVHDPVRDHFELKYIGWQDHRRVHSTVFHLDIIAGKIWVQFDGSDRPVAEALVAAGVPKSDIVIGFHPAELRQHTEFAVG